MNSRIGVHVHSGSPASPALSLAACVVIAAQAFPGAVSAQVGRPAHPVDAFCALPADSAAAREDLFRTDPHALRLAFAERLARCRSPLEVPVCLREITEVDLSVNTDVLRESLLIRDLDLVPRMQPKQRSAWLEGVRAEQAAMTASPSDAQAADFAAAASAFRAAGHLRREAIVRGSLGRCLFSLRRFDDAYDAYLRALEARRKLGDPRLIELSLRSLGSVEIQRGRPAEAVPWYEQSMQVGRARGDARSATTTRELMGQAYRLQSRFDKALECYEAALASVEAFPSTDPVVNLIHIGLAQACRELGDVQRARSVLRDEVARLAAQGEPASLRFARTRSLYGDALRRCGQLGAALEQLDTAVATLDSLGDASELARAENHLAAVHRELGQHEEALRAAQRALRHAQDSANTEDAGFAAANAGAAFGALGQMDSATTYFELALATFDETVDSSQAADVLEQWADGLVTNLLGEEAEAILRRAIAINERTGDRRRLASNVIGLGNALGVQRRLAEGRQAYARALQMLAAGLETPSLAFAASLGLADNYELAGELDSAAVYCGRAIELLEARRTDLPLADAQRISFLRANTYAYDALVNVLASLDAAAPDAGHAARALHVTELARARALLDRMHAEPPASGRAAALTQPLLPRDIQRRLVTDSKTVLLEYACSDSLAYVWVVTSKRMRLHRLAHPAEINGEVRRFRKALQAADASFIDPAQRLFELLLGPARAEIRDARVVHIVPDGDLFLLPFEALVESAPAAKKPTAMNQEPVASSPVRGVSLAPDARNMPSLDGIRYAMERARVQYAPSATVLAVLDSLATSTRHEPGSHALLALGDPANAAPLPRLPFAADEVQRIGELFPPAQRTVLTGELAREDAFAALPSLGAYQFVHFATHGVIDSLVPDRSYLVLAAAPDTMAPGNPTDGLLRVSEIERLDLDADIAVLSACETGLGRVVRGEGILGLARAFMFAGARSLVVSLWSVQDRSTAALMVDFYGGLADAKGDAGKALFRAKRRLRQSDEFAHPLFWSAFILVGPGQVSPAHR